MSLPAYSMRFLLKNDDVNVFRPFKRFVFELESLFSVMSLPVEDFFRFDFDFVDDVCARAALFDRLPLIIDIADELYSLADIRFKRCTLIASISVDNE